MQKEVSKEHRPDPIVQMGLFIDSDGLLITYNCFPTITQIKPLHFALGKIQRDYLRRIIVVADKGLTTGNNIWYILCKNGYVLSYSVRGSTKNSRIMSLTILVILM